MVAGGNNLARLEGPSQVEHQTVDEVLQAFEGLVLYVLGRSPNVIENQTEPPDQLRAFFFL